jgi:transposase InsO family protein
MSDKIDGYLNNIYFNSESPASFSGVGKLWQYIKNKDDKPAGLDYNVLAKWLKSRTTHLVHSKPALKFPTEHIIMSHIDEMFEADLIDMTNYSKYNRPYNYILTVIDVFSRFAWTKILKSKSGDDVTNAFAEILDEGRVCSILRTDQGREFLNKKFTDMLKHHKIEHRIAYGQHKANYVERFNRTFEDKLFKYFYENRTFDYRNVFDKITTSYNDTVHSSIGMAPSKVNRHNSYELYQKIYIPILNKRATTPVTFAFEVGTPVRISIARTPFSRGYNQQFTEEIFKIKRRIPSHPPRYRLEDLSQEIIRGSYYEQELQKVAERDIKHKIEKILYTRKIGGKKYSLVRWLGYTDKKFNTLIPTSSVPDYLSETQRKNRKRRKKNL